MKQIHKKTIRKQKKTFDKIIWYKNIFSFMIGKPYNRQLNTIVEKIHWTAINGLICEYLEKNKKFNLKVSIKKLYQLRIK